MRTIIDFIVKIYEFTFKTIKIGNEYRFTSYVVVMQTTTKQ